MTRWAALAAFGLLLPCWLAWSMLISHFQLQRNQAAEEVFDHLSQHLVTLENYHDDRVFFHALLQKNFAGIDNKPESAQLLARKIAAFRRLFSGRLKFIVYGSDGSINRDLTDEKRFHYILKAMFIVMHELKKLYVSDTDADPSSSAAVTSRMTLLRGYFGSFLDQKLMLEPFRSEYQGRCLFVSDEPDKHLLWYYPGTDFSLACFVDKALLGKNLGPQMIIRKFNSRGSEARLGYIQTISYKSFGLPPDPAAETEIKLEAAKFESYAIASRESRNFFVQFRQTSPEMIVVSYQSSKNLASPSVAAVSALFGPSRWLVLSFFLVFVCSLRYRRFAMPVQQKILVLFLFANGLPLLMMASTGYEFFNEKKKDLVNATHNESVRILKEFDVRFPEVQSRLARELNAFIDERNRLYKGNRWPVAEIESLKQLTARIAPQEGILLNDEGNLVFKLSLAFNSSGNMMKDLLLKGLDFFNKTNLQQSSRISKTLLDDISSEDLLLHDFLWYLGRFVVLSAGDTGRTSYMRLLGGNEPGSEEYHAWGAYAITWNPTAFMRTFIREKLLETSGAISPRQLLVFDRLNESIFSLKPADNRDIRRLFRRTVSRKLVTYENLEIDGQKYLFTSIAGNEIADGILAAIYPQSLIDEKIDALKVTFLVVGLIMAFILFRVARVFAARLLVPVLELDKGIAHMRSRDFDYRISYRSADEFGLLINTFNRTLEGMKELAVGTAVQESLLPSGRFAEAKTVLFARSLFMSKMGGDYFDYYSLPENRLGIFFGDVAGHGIPAAMIMAMIKAVIAAADKTVAGPQNLLAGANQVLLELKKRNWRRMMTAVCFDFNLLSGEFTFANAGHCYPAIVKSGGTDIRMLEFGGMPLGSSSKKQLPTIADRLAPGETLILYTDGVVEAVGMNEEQFGYRRFATLLQTAWDKDLEVYWQNIIDGYRSWAVAQDDDLTFLLLRQGGTDD
ncbi:MAG: SpoIIE family protein phosphatase [Candidatus Riflebacteria bacterium]|nr:SpoIIE family protein phosphatase [Candidatus Riflebacteria bacterium]